jgi:hypothetical protein
MLLYTSELDEMGFAPIQAAKSGFAFRRCGCPQPEAYYAVRPLQVPASNASLQTSLARCLSRLRLASSAWQRCC